MGLPACTLTYTLSDVSIVCGCAHNADPSFFVFAGSGLDFRWPASCIMQSVRRAGIYPMRRCSYCGAEYSDDVAECSIDHTPLIESIAALATAPAASSEPERPEYEFAPLSPADRQKDLVTLVRCRTLVEADLIVSRLRAAGIEAFTPDECLMQTMGFNLNTFGYVRVQVTPQDYDSARDLLSAT